ATAAGAAGGALAVLRAAAFAGLAGLQARHGDLLLDAARRVDEIDAHVDAQVGAALRSRDGPPRRPAAAENVPHREPEHAAEDVLEPGEDVGVEAAAERIARGAADAGMAEAIVTGALVGVGEDRVGLGRLLELLLR